MLRTCYFCEKFAVFMTVLGYATRIKNGYFSNFKNENERVWEPKYWRQD